MTNWRELVERAVEQAIQLNPGEEISFGEPAAEAQLAEVEAALKIQLPAQLREALKSFKGAKGQFGESIIFDTQELIDFNQEIPAIQAERNLLHPIDKAILFSDPYGNGDYSAYRLHS